MKILKILFVLAVPAVAFVGCQKSNMKPQCHATATSTAVAPAAETTTQPANRVVATPATANTNQVNGASARSVGTLVTDDNENNPITIVGSGDDDRDGGDRRRKK